MWAQSLWFPFGFFLAALAVLPCILFPLGGIPPEILQGAIAAFALGFSLLAAAVWYASKETIEIALPSSLVLLPPLALFFVAIISSIFFHPFTVAIFGSGFELGTLGSFLLFAAAVALGTSFGTQARGVIMVLLTIAVISSGIQYVSRSERVPFLGAVYVAGAAYAHSFSNVLVGTGPASFSHSWLRYRSPDPLTPPLWNTRESTSRSFLLEMLVTLGFLGALAYMLSGIVPTVVFLGSLEHRGARVLPAALLAVLPVALSFFFRPSVAIVLLGGIGIGSLAASTATSDICGSFTGARKYILLAGACAIGAALAAITFMQLYAAAIHVRAQNLAKDGNQVEATALFKSAMHAWNAPLYIRDAALSAVSLVAQQTDPVAARRFIDDAVFAANEAILIDREDFDSQLVRARVYATVMLTGYPNAETYARDSLAEAIQKAPGEALPYFFRGQLEAALGNKKEAIRALNVVLLLKPDYPGIRSSLQTLSK